MLRFLFCCNELRIGVACKERSDSVLNVYRVVYPTLKALKAGPKLERPSLNILSTS